LLIEVDRDVPIAIYKPGYRAGTARSTFPIVQKVFVGGANQEINRDKRISSTGPLFPETIRDIRAIRG